MQLDCFKAYDIRGRIPDQLNTQVLWRIGRACAQYLQPRRVCVGRDMRLSSPEFAEALAQGLMDGGADVHDIGLCGTEEVYFATSHFDMDAGIMVTASHNPADYNGLKLVRAQSRPISGDTGLNEIRTLAEASPPANVERRGDRHVLEHRPAYVQHLLSFVDDSHLRPLRLLCNPGNGCAGPVVAALCEHLPFEFVCIQDEPDGRFPNGIPNPLLPENRRATAEAVREQHCDMGIAWDGDFDRCFLFDETGAFIEGYYIVGLLAEAFLRTHPGERIIHDPRLYWNTRDLVCANGGTPVMSKTGHAFIKERMRTENAIYGGEMSAHHYFRDFAYCDSGMIPWLLVAGLICQRGQPLSTLIDERQRAYPASGEINREVADISALIAYVQDVYGSRAAVIDSTDGLSLEFDDWRFNLRASNTEPLVRLNVESRADDALMRDRTAELLELIDRFAGPGGTP